MSVLINRATYFWIRGFRGTLEARRQAWPHIDRFVVAHKLVKAVKTPHTIERAAERASDQLSRLVHRFVDVISGRELVSVKRMEARLRYLEKLGAVRIVQDRVVAQSTPIHIAGQDHMDVRVDLEETLASALVNALPGQITIDVVRERLTSVGRRFYGYRKDLSRLEVASPSLWRKMGTSIWYPRIKTIAHDFVSGKDLEFPHVEWARTETTAVRMTSAESSAAARELFGMMEIVQEASKELVQKQFSGEAVARSIRTPPPPAASREHLAAVTKPEFRKWVFVVSDIHLTGKPHARTEQFLRFLLMCVNLRATVVLNGDIFDFARPQSALQTIIENNPLIWNAFHRLEKVIYIPGNHDEEMMRIGKQQALFHGNIQLEEDGSFNDEGIFIEHGNISDPLTRPGTRWWRMGPWIAWWITKRFPYFEHWMELFARAVQSEKSWEDKKKKQIVDRVRHVYLEHRAREGQDAFSRDHPFIYVRGHEHFFGDAFLEQAIRKAIESDPDMGGGRVKFYFSSAWKDRQGYAGDVLAIDMTPDAAGRPMRTIFPIIWQYAYHKSVKRKGGTPPPLPA